MLRLRSLLPAALALLLVSAVACGDNDNEDEADEGQIPIPASTQVGGQPGQQINARVEEVIIFDDRLRPTQLQVPLGVSLRVQVANQSSRPCTFFVGDLIRGVTVEPGQATSIGVNIPTLPGRPSNPGVNVTRMGCEGDEDRQGGFVVENTGIVPPGGVAP